MSYLLLIGGLAVLVFSGDLLVRGAVGLAGRLGVPTLIIGLTVVSFGTSAPELVISIQAALRGAPGIALGNVIGSNIANILVVLGLPALIATTSCNQPLVVRNTLLMIAVTAVFIAMLLSGRLEYWHGVLLLAVFTGFIALAARRAQLQSAAARGLPGFADSLDKLPTLAVSGLLVLVGLLGLPLGAHFTIEAARAIALDWGISESAIGLTVVALGTSLPELAANFMAAIRRQGAIAVGNIIGSNIFNILVVMGVTATVVPVPVPEQMLRFDAWVMLACALALLPYVVARSAVGRIGGTAFITVYVAYVIVVIAVLGRTA